MRDRWQDGSRGASPRDCTGGGPVPRRSDGVVLLQAACWWRSPALLGGYDPLQEEDQTQPEQGQDQARGGQLVEIERDERNLDGEVEQTARTSRPRHHVALADQA